MEKAGLKNTADPCLFYRSHVRVYSFLCVAIYVVAGNKDEKIKVFLGPLQEDFKIIIGSLENFLEMQIKCQNDGSIFVSQKVYKNKILRKFNMAEAKGVSTTASREERDNHKDVSGKTGTNLNASSATCDQPATMSSGTLEVLTN
jgi:hypothetical protein